MGRWPSPHPKVALDLKITVESVVYMLQTSLAFDCGDHNKVAPYPWAAAQFNFQEMTTPARGCCAINVANNLSCSISHPQSPCWHLYPGCLVQLSLAHWFQVVSPHCFVSEDYCGLIVYCCKPLFITGASWPVSWPSSAVLSRPSGRWP